MTVARANYFEAVGLFCFASSQAQTHLLSFSVQFQKSPCQHHCNRLPSEASAGWAVLVTDAAGKNILATSPQLIKLQICLFLAALFEIVGSQWLQLQGWYDISKHLLPIYFESHIHFGVPFILSVTCHIRNSFIGNETKEQLEAKNPQSTHGPCL